MSADPEASARKRVCAESLCARVTSWKGTYGWLEPQCIIDHPELQKHQGRIFVHSEDVVPKWRALTVGALVEFFLYHDGQGLGAEECVPRKVLRLTLPWAGARVLFGEEGEKLAEFEKKMKVTMRAYQWMPSDGSNSELPFMLSEVWGRPQAIVDAILELCQDGTRCAAEILVPESRLWKVHLGQIQRCCKSAALTEDLKITDPMPCRSLTIKGTRAECSSALQALTAQVCD